MLLKTILVCGEGDRKALPRYQSIIHPESIPNTLLIASTDATVHEWNKLLPFLFCNHVKSRLTHFCHLLERCYSHLESRGRLFLFFQLFSSSFLLLTLFHALLQVVDSWRFLKCTKMDAMKKNPNRGEAERRIYVEQR